MAGTEFVQVTTILTPPQQQPQNPNNIALLTTESLIAGVGDFTVHTSLKSVADSYGTVGETYKMANAIFSQSPNILTGKGSLTIIPFAGVHATRTTISTTSLLNKVDTFKAITDGKLKIVVTDASVSANSITIDATELNFTNITTISDIKAIFEKKISPAYIKIEVIDDALKFTNLKYGASGTMSIEASTSTGTDLLDATLLDNSTFITVSSANASEETIVEALTRIQALPQGTRPLFEAVLTNLKFELDYANNSYLKTTAAYLSGIEKIFIYSYSALQDTVNALQIKDANYSDFKFIFHKDSERLEIVGGATGLLFSNDTNLPSASATLNKKIITGCTPCVFLTDTMKVSLKNAGVDYYIDNVGTPAYVSNKTNGGFIDDRYNVKIVTLEYITAYDNSLTTSTKIAQVQSGVDYIIGNLNSTATKLRRNGIIGTGIKWSSDIVPTSITRENFDRIMYNEGFYAEAPNIALQSQADREARRAPPIRTFSQLGSAIHDINSVIYLQR